MGPLRSRPPRDRPASHRWESATGGGMNGTLRHRSEPRAFDVAVIRRRSGPADASDYVPRGHCLSRARLRYLCESDWIVVRHGSGTVGLAAYKRADGDVRVVQEFLLDPTLAGPDAVQVTDALLSALEMVAYEEGVRCLTFLLRSRVLLGPFEQRGYTSLALDSGGIWLQRKFGWLGWCEAGSPRPN